MDVAVIVAKVFEIAFKYLPQIVSLIEQIVAAFKQPHVVKA